MSLSCHLVFDGVCDRAFRAYQRILGGELKTLLTFGQSPLAEQLPPDWQGRILHATLVLDDQELMGSDAFPGAYAQPQGFSVTVGYADVDRARAVFDALADGGRLHMPFQATFWSPGFGVLVDRYGVPWEVNCTAAAQENPAG